MAQRRIGQGPKLDGSLPRPDASRGNLGDPTSTFLVRFQDSPLERSDSDAYTQDDPWWVVGIVIRRGEFETRSCTSPSITTRTLEIFFYTGNR